MATPVPTPMVKMRSPRHHGYEGQHESLIYMVDVFACKHAVSVTCCVNFNLMYASLYVHNIMII